MTELVPCISQYQASLAAHHIKLHSSPQQVSQLVSRIKACFAFMILP
jgi:hypothetical protein